jgi:hypothetical protein
MTVMSDDIRKAIKAHLTTPRGGPTNNPHRRRIIAREGRGGRRSRCDVARSVHHSEALGVNPDQIEEATDALRQAGVMADFDAEGCLVVTSQRQFREAAKALGMFNGRDGYGTLNDAGHREDTGRVQKDKRERFRRHAERYDLGQDCDPEIAAIFEGV